MASNDDQRNYNLLDADLCMFASILTGFLTRDLTDFAKFGLTAPKIAAFKALGDAFEVFPTDGTLVGDVMVATEDKNALREQVLTSITEMALRVEAKWGVNSGKYKRLDLKNPSKLTDELLLTAARMVHLKMTDYLTDLTPFGLSQQILDDFEDLNEQFELAKKAQADAIALRDEKRKERVEKGNELYDLVSTYCGFGKSLYEKTNSAKYNDYIIYTPSAGALTAPTGLAFDPATLTFSWNEVENATSYVLQSSNDGVNFSNVYSGSGLSTVFEPTYAGNNYFRVKARNSGGMSEASEVLTVEYYSTLPAPQNLQAVLEGSNVMHVTFDAVPTAEIYKIYRFVADLYAPAGVFEIYGDMGSNDFSRTVETGKRTYFKFKAVSGTKESDFSHMVYLDVQAGV